MLGVAYTVQKLSYTHVHSMFRGTVILKIFILCLELASYSLTYFDNNENKFKF